MNIIINNSSGKPIYEQITNQIKTMVIKGELREGDALPSMRLLAKELKISVITTKRAYEELEKDGFIETIVGKGSFIAKKNVESIKEENLKIIEEVLKKAVNIGKVNNISCETLKGIIEILYERE
ncbi:MAG: GntR family transcriptional regulator [Clostridium perfringens]|nr:GntR family transcriptional regulator [Clostridium perfringens]